MNSENLIAPELYNITDEIAKFSSEKTALIWKNEHNETKTWSYRHLLEQANKFANVVKDAGIKKGDHVIVMTPRLLETYAIYMGLWKAGAIIIPASELLKAHDLEYRIHHANVKAIVSYNGMTAEFDKIENTPSVSKKIIVGDKLSGWDHYETLMEDGYGQTESTLLIGTLVDTPIRPGSMGKPIMPEYMAIIDADGNPVGVGEIGDIAMRRDFPALFKEYYKEPERLQKAIRGDYFVSGDRAIRDEDNYYWFQGRNDDIIISSGYTIGPFEVEDALTHHPAVKEVAVVASPDEIRGTVVKAFIVLKDGYEGTDDLVHELQTFTKEQTAPYKYPRRIEFVEALPKTDSGKIRRVELRDAEFASVHG
ncbi:hypothetical protein A7H04_03045 [Listeria monocytogenes]|nr:hypothetical protein [Listeria monocytogenes]EAG0455257.1 hypothetical protein [Listeria monocytogenes]EAG0623514.1 hypothetical protein [Listeria monocytogenes]EAG2933414.1 hypothetical protein [Listeria monocytogenes]